MEAARGHIGAAGVPAPSVADERPSRLTGLASDERLVGRIRRGDEAAFTVLYKRYQPRLLSFCRHMLGSQAEGEDAVQQTFVNAYRDIVRSDKRLELRPWLYRIARNQCLTMLRARKQTAELSGEEPSLIGLSQQVRERSDLRSMLVDLAALPYQQREALVLVELHDNSHAEVADVLGCDREKVKSLVFQARSSLMKTREAREVSCTEIQQQLSVLRGGALRRTVIRRHLEHCDACRAFRAEVKRQRAAMAAILPVVPGIAFKFGAGSALAAGKAAAAGSGAAVTGGGAAVGGGVAAAGGSAGTGAVAAGTTSAAAGTSVAGSGVASTVAAKLGVSAAAIKGAAAAAAVTVAVGGGAAGVEVARHARHAPQSAAHGGERARSPDRAASKDLPTRGTDLHRRKGAPADKPRLRLDRRQVERPPRAARGVDRRRSDVLPGRRAPGQGESPTRPNPSGGHEPGSRRPQRQPLPQQPRPPKPQPTQPTGPRTSGDGGQLPPPPK